MNNKFIKNPFWYLFGPILSYWLIGFAVKFIAEFVVLMPHMTELLNESLAAGVTSQEQLMQMIMSKSGNLFELLFQHQVEILAIGAVFTIPVTFYLFRSDRKREIDFHIPQNKKAEPSKYIQLIVFGIATCIGLNALAFMSSIALYSPKYQETSQVLYTPAFPVQLICLGIIVPLAEELIFRGVLFRRIRVIGSFKRAAIFSTMLFSLSHGNIVQLVYTLILGMFLAYVYEKYGSFKAPLILHIVVNITSLVLTETGGFGWFAAKALRLAVVTIVCAFIGSAMYVLIQKIDERPEFVVSQENNTPTQVEE